MPLSPRSALGAAAVLTLLTAGAASAHTSLIGSTPSDGARLARGPAEIRLLLEDPVRPGLSTVVVTGPDGADVTARAPEVHRNEVVQRLRPDVPEGTYRVVYRVVSTDGHTLSGTTGFSVSGLPPAATMQRLATSAQTQTPTAASSSTLPLTSSMAAGAVLVTAVVAMRRRRTSEQEHDGA
jgi:methionine-rich copper-binding protein CopC